MISTNEINLKLGWQKITTLRNISDGVSLRSGKPLSRTTFAILCCIAHQNDSATITTIRRHPYFNNISLSTIRRAITILLGESLIRIAEGSLDRRERFISIQDM
jgi:DNA-binding MarR family transcriptional regulator